MYHKVLSQVIWVTIVAGERAVFYTVHVNNNRCIKWPEDEGGFVKASGHMFLSLQFLEWTLDNHNDDNDNDYIITILYLVHDNIWSWKSHALKSIDKV